MNSLDGKYSLDGSSSAEKMAESTFGTAHIHLGGLLSAMLAEQESFDRLIFGSIPERRRCRMRVDVVDGRRLELGILESFLHGQQGARAVFSRCRQVVGIGRATIAR